MLSDTVGTPRDADGAARTALERGDQRADGARAKSSHARMPSRLIDVAQLPECCQWCDYPMTGLERGSQCPECGRIPARRRLRDAVCEQVWPPLSRRSGLRRNAEAYFRRGIGLLIALEIVGGVAFAVWWMLGG